MLPLIALSQTKISLPDSVQKYRSIQPGKAMLFAHQAFDQLKTESQKAESLLWLGVLNSDISRYDSSEIYLTQSLTLFISVKDSSGMADVFQGLGEVKENLGLYSEALNLYQKGFAIRKKGGVDAEVARSLNSIGNIYVFLTNYPLALENYLESLKISEREKNEKEIANAYNNIGMVYDYTGDLDKGLEYYDRARIAYEALGDKRGLAGALNNIGLIYKNKSQPEKSIAYYQQSLKLFEELKSPYGVAALQNNLGVAHGKMNNQELAIQYYRKALETNTKIGNSDGIANSNNSLGDANLKLKQFAKADEYFNRGLSVAKQIDSKDRMAESFEGLALAREGMKDFKNAFSYSQRARVLRDSLYTTEKSQKLYEMEQKYESALKENQIALLHSESELQKSEIKQKNEMIDQRNTQLLLVGATVFFLGVAIYMFYSRLRFKQKAAEELTRIEQEQALIKHVYEQRLSISKDMHDEIGSGLTQIALLSSSITSKIIEPNLHHELQIISGTSRGLVQSMNEIVWALNPQHETLENLCAYLREQTHNYFEPFNIHYAINLPERLPDVKLSNRQRRNIFLVTKEALNNSLKYAQPLNISLTMRLSENVMRFEVVDNGQGFDMENVRRTANGLRNMKDRMREVNGTFEISSSSRGTNVFYSVPFDSPQS
jgi:signal transduction histidine kinase